MSGALPNLRQDLTLLSGENDKDGFPTWKIYDPTRHQYFKIGWSEFEILSRWQVGEADAIVTAVNSDTTLTIDSSHIERVLQFLQANDLVESVHREALSNLLDKRKRIEKPKGRFAPHKWLFLRFRLIRPDKFLTKTLPYVKFFYTREFWFVFAAMLCISVYLIGRDWERFINTFLYFYNPAGLAYLFTGIFVSKIIHEFAHAYTAKYYGCRVPAMGVVFLVFWPVFYTDTTDAWQLSSRKKQLYIGAAGMMAELVLAVFASFAWVFLPDGVLRSIAFFIATVAWVMTLFINLNPFLRFDGYYLFSDLLQVDNLQSRSFALARWWLREKTCGFGEDAPYQFPKKKRKILIVYAFLTWGYRFLIFTGIAFILYNFFFKLLAFIFIAFMIGSMIIKPILDEVGEYWKRRDKIKLNRKFITTMTVLIFTVLLLSVPWYGHINAPATLEYRAYTRLYAPSAGKIQTVHVKQGVKVKKGQLLFTLDSPEIDYKLAKAKSDVEIVRKRLLKESKESEELGYRQAGAQDLNEKLQAYRNLLEERERLAIRAPFAGTITAIPDMIRTGHWVAEDTFLGELVMAREPIIQAYIPEQDLLRAQKGDVSLFYSDAPGYPSIRATIQDIDTVSTQKLTAPYHASTFGGDLPVNEDKDGNMVLTASRYRVLLKPEDVPQVMQHVMRGHVVIRGQARSFLYRAWVAVSGVLVRESNF